MNYEEIISSGIIEQYVLGITTQVENEDIDILRKKHPAIHDAIVQFEKQFEDTMMQQSVLPSKITDDKILATLNSLSTKNTVSSIATANPQPAKIVRFNFAKLAAAAAILLLAVSAYFNYNQYQDNKNQQALLQAKNYTPTLPVEDYNVLKNPSIVPVAMMGVGLHAFCKCTMFWDKSTGKAYVMVHHLVESGDTKEFQLWANVNGKMTNVGTLNDKVRTRFIEVKNMPNDASEFLLTLENKGVAATTPNQDEIILKGRI